MKKGITVKLKKHFSLLDLYSMGQLLPNDSINHDYSMGLLLPNK